MYIKSSNIILCGNKVDDENNRKILKMQGEELAKIKKYLFFEISAKEGININQAFYKAISTLPCFESYPGKDIEDLLGIIINT